MEKPTQEELMKHLRFLWERTELHELLRIHANSPCFHEAWYQQAKRIREILDEDAYGQD